MSRERVRRAEHSDIDALATVGARALVDDPFIAWLFPDAASRTGKLREFLAATLELQVPFGDALVTDDRKAFAIIHPASAASRPHLLGSLAAMDASSRRRYARAVAVLKRRRGRAPHWYVESLAVDPASQGHGKGVALIREVTRLSAPGGERILLETFTEHNVGFYRGQGFDVMHVETDLPLDAPDVWLLERRHAAIGARPWVDSRCSDRDADAPSEA